MVNNDKCYEEPDDPQTEDEWEEEQDRLADERDSYKEDEDD